MMFLVGFYHVGHLGFSNSEPPHQCSGPRCDGKLGAPDQSSVNYIWDAEDGCVELFASHREVFLWGPPTPLEVCFVILTG